MNSFFGRDAGYVEKQELFVEPLCNLVVAKDLSLEHWRPSATAESDGDRTAEEVEKGTTARGH